MNIEEFCKKYNFGKVYNISKLSGGLMHKMFKVETEKGIYCIKILNPEVMSRKDAYNNFVISESISKNSSYIYGERPSQSLLSGTYVRPYFLKRSLHSLKVLGA